MFPSKKKWEARTDKSLVDHLNSELGLSYRHLNALLQQLYMGDREAEAFCSALGTDALPHCFKIDISRNSLQADGLHAWARLLSQGDEGRKALPSVLRSRSLSAGEGHFQDRDNRYDCAGQRGGGDQDLERDFQRAAVHIVLDDHLHAEATAGEPVVEVSSVYHILDHAGEKCRT